jgi:DNA (cytosine-5)-methyltransferase 1
VTRPRLLDLFCGAGGAAVGYHRAGFDVTGVDIAPQPRYPFEFHHGDAVLDFDEFVSWGFDAIHASPPCQAYSIANNIHARDDHPNLLAQTRELLQATGLPWVIENVPGAPMNNWVVLCGQALGTGVKRHRWFESNIAMLVPPCPHGHPGDWVSVFGHTVLSRGHVIGKAKGGGNRIARQHLGTDVGREAMGIDWMTRDELSEAIPPAYTEWIGAQLLAHLEAAA